MDAQAKQQIVERVKQATNVLVTVSANPTVDQLAACIGLTLLLNKMQKHGTAVFSGKVPSTIEFLQPEKTIETNTDSLQDFIISLDKSKADKLRYKVEDQVVRIFITPYRTSIGEKDLVFSQGDFNVDVVIALGIKDRNQIDQAIASHGRILHDATVITLNSGPGTAPQLGQINWQDPAASSLCEMLVSISEAFGAGLIDNQMATAFLTGIVAETARFSNSHTSSKVMTMAAQLMAAGANQQLIVSKLEPPPPPPPPTPPPTPKPEPPKPQPPMPKPPEIPKPTPPKPAPMPPKAPPLPSVKKDGTLSISHEKTKPDDQQEIEIAPNEILIDKQGNLHTPKDLDAAKNPSLMSMPKPAETPPPAPAPLPDIKPTPAPAPTPPPPPPPTPPAPLPPPPPAKPPVITPLTQEIQGHALLDPSKHSSNSQPPFTADMEQEWIDPYNSVSTDPLGERSPEHGGFLQPTSGAAKPATDGNIDQARNAVQNALASAPTTGVEPAIQALNAQPMGPELQTPPPAGATATPSLTLPTTANGGISAATPYMQAPSDIAPPAPPPVPPPLPLTSNPGAMIPGDTPTFTPPSPAS